MTEMGFDHAREEELAKREEGEKREKKQMTEMGFAHAREEELVVLPTCFSNGGPG